MLAEGREGSVWQEVGELFAKSHCVQRMASGFVRPDGRVDANMDSGSL